MLPRPVLILALLATAFVAPATLGGTDPACYTRPPHEETVAISATSYLYLGTQTDKVGVWDESNGRAGLQTTDCLNASGDVVILAKDTHSTKLPTL